MSAETSPSSNEDSDSSSQSSDFDTEPFRYPSTTDPTSVKDQPSVEAFPPENDLVQVNFGKWMIFRL